MKRIGMVYICFLLLFLPIQNHVYSKELNLNVDSLELQVQDIMMLQLTDPVSEAVKKYYAKSLKEVPVVYPYDMSILHIERMDGFRSFRFKVVLEVVPVIGPHISVGRDRVTLLVTEGETKVISFEHIETFELPPKWAQFKKEE
ncbi:DUF3888 domain-containing protein [Alkalihalophilus marmarensis]|jgi:hypothetical protein|uniref:DUF3888 domain-containing protein n=1 Tax=Alkalihalophilus marmarensis TaxID=521377 RepID=UPI0020409D83|nr:DUF3888 domain-containing protein [Alkalihalophilus marmarensis]MCM3491024.1 DUF3888 domain-containing protein [Alkalihalophilus marmarensis]